MFTDKQIAALIRGAVAVAWIIKGDTNTGRLVTGAIQNLCNNLEGNAHDE